MPFTYWRAFMLGIIDADGMKLREPTTPNEKQIYNVFDELIRRIKVTMLKYIPNKGILRFKIYKDMLSDTSELNKIKEQLKLNSKMVLTESHNIVIEDFIINYLREKHGIEI